MISIDQLLQSLFQDVAKAGTEDTPGEMVRSSLAGQMPSAGPSGGSMSLPMSLGGPRMGGAPRVPGPPPVPGPRAPMAGAGPAPTQVAQAPYIPGNAMTDAAEGYRSGGLIGAIGNLMQGPEMRAAAAQQYQRQQAEAQAQRNMTIDAIRSRYKDMPPEMAAVIARDSKLLQEYLGPPGSRPSDQESFGTTVQYEQMPDGKLRPFVVGNRGGVKYLDTKGEMLGPEGLAAAKARGSISGKTIGQAQKDLPKALESAAKITSVLSSLESDPYLDSMLGPMRGRMPNVFADAERVQSYMDQIQGAAFLQAFESLKGGGQITQIEGEKATDAITRLKNPRMAPKDYRQAIDDLKKIAHNSVVRAKVEAGQLGPEALDTLWDVTALGLPSIGGKQDVEIGQPKIEGTVGASGKSRIIGVE